MSDLKHLLYSLARTEEKAQLTQMKCIDIEQSYITYKTNEIIAEYNM